MRRGRSAVLPARERRRGVRHGTIPEPAVVSTDDEMATHQRENEDVTTGLGSTATTRRPTRPPTASAAAARAIAALAAATMVGAAAIACGGGGGGDATRQGNARGARGGALSVETARRALVVAFAAETLSSAARILALYPGSGPDSAVIGFTFADSTRGVSAGLGVLDPRADDAGRVAHLAWPDSVRQVWWAGRVPHALIFTTAMGRGVTAVKLDVAADTLGVATASWPEELRVPAPPASQGVGKAAIDRAVAFVDSAHGQPASRAAPNAALRYAVDAMIAATDGRLAAFHVIASDSAGRRLNPAWYVLSLPNGAVASVDSVVGPATELPASAGAWGGAHGRTFYYARGTGVYEARVR
jgi:hypothetical protein